MSFKEYKNITCDCDYNVTECLYFTVYRCKTGRHNTCYKWKKPFPVKVEVIN